MRVWGILGALVVLALTVTGASVSIYYAREISRARVSVGWPTTMGRVVSSKVCIVRYRGVAYQPSVHYRYEVGGHTYDGSTIAFGHRDPTAHRAEVDAILARYPRDEPSVVYYDPDAPNISCLEPGYVLDGTYIPIALGVLASAVGIALTAIQRPIRHLAFELRRLMNRQAN